MTQISDSSRVEVRVLSHLFCQSSLSLQSRAVPTSFHAHILPSSSPALTPQREAWGSLLIRMNGAGLKMWAIRVKFWISWFQTLQWFPITCSLSTILGRVIIIMGYGVCMWGGSLSSWISPLQECFSWATCDRLWMGCPFANLKMVLFCYQRLCAPCTPVPLKLFLRGRKEEEGREGWQSGGKEEKKDWRKPTG